MFTLIPLGDTSETTKSPAEFAGAFKENLAVISPAFPTTPLRPITFTIAEAAVGVPKQAFVPIAASGTLTGKLVEEEKDCPITLPDNRKRQISENK
jgi:hypothetical protein